MDDGSQILWIVILAFFCFAFYFAIAETSFASVSKVRIKASADNGSRRAKKALKVLNDFDYAVTTILIGTNITHLGIASIVTVLVIRKWGAGFVSASTIITTIAVFFLSEMLPKSIAKRYCDSLSLLTASSLLFFMKLFYPISFILTAIGQWAARLVGNQEEVTVTEEELHDIIEDLADDGVLGEEQSELMDSALDFADETVGGILTPLHKTDVIDADTLPCDVIAYLLSHSHSRYPIYDKTQDKIIGTLRMREYLMSYRQNPDIDLREMADPPLYTHYGDSVSDLLREMNEKKLSMAIVLDDNDKFFGVTTTEDALEALVGDVWGGVPA